MSRIEFESKDGSAEVYGSERAALTILLEKLSLAFLQPLSNHDLLVPVIPSTHYLAGEYESHLRWAEDFRATLRYESRLLVIDETPVNAFDMMLNTALVTGNDVMKLAASIHGQCEVNAYIRGKNRTWVADIIESDKANVFRPGRGWEDVVKFLRSSDQETVFMGYSVTDGIISTAMKYWMESTSEERDIDMDDWEDRSALEDEWEALGNAKHWEIADEWADFAKPYGLEVSPERFNSDFVFGDGMNAGKLIGILERKREEEQAKNSEFLPA